MVHGKDIDRPRKIDTWITIPKDRVRVILKKLDLDASNYQGKEFVAELNRDYSIALSYFGNRPGIELKLMRRDVAPDKTHFRELIQLLPFAISSDEIVMMAGKFSNIKFLKATLYKV